jgi:hypothetical protein
MISIAQYGEDDTESATALRELETPVATMATVMRKFRIVPNRDSDSLIVEYRFAPADSSKTTGMLTMHIDGDDVVYCGLLKLLNEVLKNKVPIF